MKEDVKSRWVNALRSGAYKQGYGQLKIQTREGIAHCCLGVLCELAVQEGVIRPSFDSGEKSSSGVVYHAFEDENILDGETSGSLPQKVMEWAGLRQTNPVVPRRNKSNALGLKTISLAEINDNGTNPFEKIADIIEEHL